MKALESFHPAVRDWFLKQFPAPTEPQAQDRVAMTKKPPNIIVTTPESLYILLTSDGGRKILSTVRTLIVDEIHAMVDDKRGSHLSLSVERLEALVHASHKSQISDSK